MLRWADQIGPRAAWAQALRVLLALGTVMGGCWAAGRADWVLPLFLGLLACALAETDDSWQGRLRALLVTLGCFALVVLALTALQARPLWFLLALLLCSLGFTMLGALGGRYRSISAATILVALYTALSLPQQGAAAPAWYTPLLLLAGAAWYGLCSLLWCVLAPLAPLRESVAQLYDELGAYLQLKSGVFEPLRGMDMRARRLELAQANARVVGLLDAAKYNLLSHLGPQAPSGTLLVLLNLYFIAQDIHERASSSHYPYEEWADELFHSDVLYRCQRVLRLTGGVCTGFAGALRARRALLLDAACTQALADLHGSIAHLDALAQPAWARPLRSLRALARNMDALHAQLRRATERMDRALLGDINLFDATPHTLGAAWALVRAQLHWRSPLLRHALRLSLALGAGHVLMQLTDPRYGYWILLTTLLVCQPTYGATVLRVAQRVSGTVLGLVLGWALLRLFPSPDMQAVLMVAAAVLFFVTRGERYVPATAAVTTMVLSAFSGVAGDAQVLIWPRLLDTLMGAALAAAALFLVLPDWQGRRLAAVAAAALRAQAGYLRAIAAQHATGKEDDLAYRLVRRRAHEGDAALSNTLGQMLREPPWVRRHAQAGLDLLVQLHTLLNYLSALGAHRGVAHTVAPQAPLQQLAQQVAAQIEQLAQDLAAQRLPQQAGCDPATQALLQALEQQAEDSGAQVLALQLAMVCRHIHALRSAVTQLVQVAPSVQDT